MAPKIQTSVTLFGKSPWGFSVAGDKHQNQPLVVSKVQAGSVASRGNLHPGDVIIALNGDSAAEMSVKQCEEKMKKATASLYLILVKNGATVTVKPSGEVAIEGDRDVYNDESSELKRLSQYNRSAKPFPGSPTPTSPPITPPTLVDDWSKTRKPVGFRSVFFSPKEPTKNPERQRNGGA